MKYKIDLSNGYGSNYVTKRNNMWYFGLSCCVQQDQELPITSDTAKDLINASGLTLSEALEYDKDWSSINSKYNYDLEVQEYKLLHSYWDEAAQDVIGVVLFEGQDNFSLANFVFENL